METLVYVGLFIALYFEVFLLVSFVDAKRNPGPLPTPRTSWPSVTIVVPCFNEEAGIARSLHSLLALEYPQELLSVIIVNDGSTDRTGSIAETFTNDSRVTLLTKENGGKHSAMNLALSHTTSEFIGCLDADSTVAPDALTYIISAFSDDHIVAVTPGINVRDPQTALQHLQNVEYRLSIFNRYALSTLGSVFITPGPFSFFRTQIIKKVGGWRHGHSTEDMEMGMRLQEHGYSIVNEPRAIVETTTPPTLRRLIKQRVRWSYGFLRNTLDYRHMVGNPRYGNLGIFVLPTALVSIFTAIFFAGRIMWNIGESAHHFAVRVSVLGLPTPQEPSLFYVNTSMALIISLVALSSTIALITIGSYLSRGEKRPPLSTPLFLALYSLVVPIWLSIAVLRAVFKTGVKWR